MNLKSPEYVQGHDLIKGKSVLITAAAGAGIGFSAATKAAEEGARAIVLSDIHEGRLAAAVEKLKQESGLAEVYGKMGNVAVEEDVRSLVDFAEEKMGGVDILINNAGLGSSKLLIEMEDDEWNRVIDVTLNGTMRMTRYMMKVMKARGQGGVIVNNASVLGWRAQKEQSHYAAAKAGLIGLTRYFAARWGPAGIRVNAIAPGGVESGQNDVFVKRYGARVPMGRMGRSDEIVGAVVWLASDAASYVTGQVISVDGGLTAW